MRQKIIEKILYPLLTSYHGSNELSILKELLKSERISEDQLYSLRFDRLKILLKHANDYSPFYQKRFAESGFEVEKIKDFNDLSKLPLLTKQDIQENRSEIISTFYQPEALEENRTGGSTGSPLVFFHNKERVDIRQAATLRHNLWAGYHVGCKAAILWGHQSDVSLFSSLKARVRQWLIDRTVFYDSSSFTDDKLLNLAREFKSYKPDIILAYANTLAFVVEFLQERGIVLPSPKAIITSAEVLTVENRAKIENYFNTKIFDRYGCREVSVIASECEAHDGLHINAENLYLEFLDENQQEVDYGTEGELVVTDLMNYGFPFIRYQIADVAVKAEGQCSCGRTLPKLKNLAGRTTDFLFTPDGRKVSGAAMTIYLVAEVPGIRQAQIVQKEIDSLIFNLVVDDIFDDSSRALFNKKVIHFFGGEMKYQLNMVDQIKREPSGKYRFSICEMEGK